MAPRVDRLAPVFFRRDIADGLGELPPVTGKVFEGTLTFSILVLRKRLDYSGTEGAGTLELGVHVFDPDLDHMSHRARLG